MIRELIEAARPMLRFGGAYEGDTLVAETEEAARLRKAIETIETAEQSLEN